MFFWQCQKNMAICASPTAIRNPPWAGRSFFQLIFSVDLLDIIGVDQGERVFIQAWRKWYINCKNLSAV